MEFINRSSIPNILEAGKVYTNVRHRGNENFMKVEHEIRIPGFSSL